MPILLQTGGIALDCPAKLNLTLAVGAPRGDGLHPIASVMVALDLGDTLYLNPLNHGPSRFIREWDPKRFDLQARPDEPAIQAIDWPIEQDLIYRAHALMQKELGTQLPIECGLNKRIPAGAGLGGGSSDAAGMLVGLRALLGLDVSDDRLIALGQSLGADVGFLVHALLGRPAALVTGIGEVVEALPQLPAFDAVLVFPAGACPTAAVYSGFDQIAGEQKDAKALAGLASSWRGLGGVPAPMNDLAAAAEQVCPAMIAAKQALAQLDCDLHLTGSAALFILADDAGQAASLAGKARSLGVHARPARFDPDRFSPVNRL